ncbi:MAG: rRNA maturation RNase YbeY [Pirellulales bacterium]|nr:rRNA maturation RNase YbeY [Pirellulales bacterium]
MPEDAPLPLDDPEPAPGSLTVELAVEVDAPLDESRLREAVRAAFDEDAYDDAVISVAIVDDPTIQRLNRQYLDHDYATDVLSFPLVDEPPTRFEGQIVASLETAVACAAEAGWNADDELLLYVVHGALHLAGHDDHAPAAKRRMLAAEIAALDRLGIERSPTDLRWRPADGGVAESSAEGD